MSFTPPFPPPNAAFVPRYKNDLTPSGKDNYSFKSNEGYQANVQNNFTNYNTNSSNNPNNLLTSNPSVPVMYTNAPNQELSPNRFYDNSLGSRQQSIKGVSFPFPAPVNTCPSGTLNSGSQRTGFSASYSQYCSNQPVPQIPNRNPVVPYTINSDNAYFNNDQRNISNQRFSYPGQNTAYNNSPPTVNYHGYQNAAWQSMPGSNFSKTFNSLPQIPLTACENTSSIVTSTVNNSVFPSNSINNQVFLSGINNNPLTVPSVLMNLSQVPTSQFENNCSLNIPPPVFLNNSSLASSSSNVVTPLISEKELKLADFLAKFCNIKRNNENKVTIPEFCSTLKTAFSIMKFLSESKCKLTNLIDASDDEWNSEVQCAINLQKQLSEMCSLLSSPIYLNSILKKLKFINRKRGQNKKTKLNKLSEKIKAEQNRKELNQEIDKWLDDIKEKNLKLKREVEMKKEADFILLEVRRKIQEANRTIEKIKVFEKLRNARQANAIKKGLHIMSEHNEKFEKKVLILKKMMLKQLADYEAEEKALKVMLETEQEGQLEEEAQWKIKKAKTIQQKKQNHINECLFGISDDPLSTDSMYLFHKYHTSANSSIENLVQIRHQWDVHIAEDGEAVPQQWVIPLAPSNSSWEQYLTMSRS